MASLHEYVVSTLPRADPNAINQMLDRFDSFGIHEPCDIAYIRNEAELSELKTIEARKLLEKVRRDFIQEEHGQKQEMTEDGERKYCELEIQKLQVRQTELDLEIIKATNEANERNATIQRIHGELNLEIRNFQKQLGEMKTEFEITRARDQRDAKNERDRREKLQMEASRKKVYSGIAGTALVGAGIVALACPPAGLAWLGTEVAGFTISGTAVAGLAAIGGGGKLIKDAVVENPVATRMIGATPEGPTGQRESPATETDEPRLPADGQSTHGQRKKRQ